jgi:hypothetical protein
VLARRCEKDDGGTGTAQVTAQVTALRKVVEHITSTSNPPSSVDSVPSANASNVHGVNATVPNVQAANSSAVTQTAVTAGNVHAKRNSSTVTGPSNSPSNNPVIAPSLSTNPTSVSTNPIELPHSRLNPNTRIVLLEASNRFGGQINTVSWDEEQNGVAPHMLDMLEMINAELREGGRFDPDGEVVTTNVQRPQASSPQVTPLTGVSSAEKLPTSHSVRSTSTAGTKGTTKATAVNNETNSILRLLNPITRNFGFLLAKNKQKKRRDFLGVFGRHHTAFDGRDVGCNPDVDFNPSKPDNPSPSESYSATLSSAECSAVSSATTSATSSATTSATTSAAASPVLLGVENLSNRNPQIAQMLNPPQIAQILNPPQQLFPCRLPSFPMSPRSQIQAMSGLQASREAKYLTDPNNQSTPYLSTVPYLSNSNTQTVPYLTNTQTVPYLSNTPVFSVLDDHRKFFRFPHIALVNYRLFNTLPRTDIDKFRKEIGRMDVEKRSGKEHGFAKEHAFANQKLNQKFNQKFNQSLMPTTLPIDQGAEGFVFRSSVIPAIAAELGIPVVL